MVENKGARSDIFKGVGRQVLISSDDDFLKIKETLSRIGTVSDQTKLMQVCYILHKRGQYVVIHYKELLRLDGVVVEIDDVDLVRRNSVAELLQQWKLLTIVDSDDNQQVQMCGLKVVPYRERDKWSFFSLYNIGRK